MVMASGGEPPVLAMAGTGALPEQPDNCRPLAVDLTHARQLHAQALARIRLAPSRRQILIWRGIAEEWQERIADLEAAMRRRNGRVAKRSRLEAEIAAVERNIKDATLRLEQQYALLIGRAKTGSSLKEAQDLLARFQEVRASYTATRDWLRKELAALSG
jgi:hypothetical protein